MEFCRYFVLKHNIGPRYASEIVCALENIASPVYMQFKDKHINAKSLIGVLSLGLKQDDCVEIITNGGNDTINHIIDVLSDLQ
jgi:phosphotransferase system HPr (HPr) family protein